MFSFISFFVYFFYTYIYFLVLTFVTWRLVISQIFLREPFFAGVCSLRLKKAFAYCCQKIEQNSHFFFCPDIGGEFSFPEARRNKVFEAVKTFQLLLEGIERIKQALNLTVIFSPFTILAIVFFNNIYMCKYIYV